MIDQDAPSAAASNPNEKSTLVYQISGVSSSSGATNKSGVPGSWSVPPDDVSLRPPLEVDVPPLPSSPVSGSFLRPPLLESTGPSPPSPPSSPGLGKLRSGTMQALKGEMMSNRGARWMSDFMRRETERTHPAWR